MITESPPRDGVGRVDEPRWQQSLRTAIRSRDALLRRLGIVESAAPHGAAAAEAQFPVFAPLPYVERIRPGDPRDPLLLQVLAVAEESQAVPGFVPDPLDEDVALRAPRLLQKYAGRALLITTSVCAVHCRYCFRRHFPYDEQGPNWEPALAELERDESIEEVLLSGGDPWMLADEPLAELHTRLRAIPWLRRIRVHTRLPIMIPERVTPRLLETLRPAGGRGPTSLVVVHANHPAELDDAVLAALGRLVDHGVPVLNQSVLLRGVNDDVEILSQLSLRLLDARVLPYNLNQLDRVQGAAHFEVPVERGLAILAALRERLPGYAVPRYVRELPGATHKVPLG